MSAQNVAENNLINKGVPIEIIVKVKPEPYQRQDLRVYENKISLLDKYDRPVEEFITNGSIFEQTDSFRNNFDNLFKKYLSALIQGVNFNIFTFGAKSSGKTFSLEGNTNESGVYSLFIENLFSILESKRDAIIEEIQSSESPELESTSFSYNIKMKFVEIKDESITDLLHKYNFYKQPAQILYTESDGYAVSGAAWVGLPNSMVFPELFSEAIKYRTNQDYNKVNKSSTIMTLEITQVLENRTTRDIKNIVSKVNIFDLPSADILAENFRNMSNSLEFRSIYSFQSMIAELAKSNNNVLPTVYENSNLTKLMKDHIGGGGLCMGIFCLQNNNYPISNIVFKIMKICSHIQNYPIVMDSNSIGLLRKFRSDISFYTKYKDSNLNEIRPPIIIQEKIEPTLSNNLSNFDTNSINELKRKLLLAENEIEKLRRDLAYFDEENKRLLHTLARKSPVKAENNLSNLVYPPAYDPINKLEHLEEDFQEVNEIMMTVNKLSEKVKELQEERRLLDEENSNLRATNQTLATDMDKVTIEANNYKTNAENELYNLKEVLNSTKNELEYMRNEAEKYRKIQSDLLLELDEREVQFKKQLEDRERDIENKMTELTQGEKKKIDTELRESRRKVEQLAEENSEYNKVIEEMKKEMNKSNLKINEMRNTLRDTLGRSVDDKNDKKLNIAGMQINPNSKIKLIKTYTDRENELLEQIALEKAKCENLKEKLKKMRTFARKVRNLALDNHPINEELPSLLTKDLDVFLEEGENESIIQFLEYEVKTLRERNKKIEFEMKSIKKDEKRGVKQFDDIKKQKLENNWNDINTMPIPNKNIDGNSKIIENSQILNNSEIHKKLLDEIEKLKNNRPFSTSKENEKLKKEKDILVEENKKLKIIINENLPKSVESNTNENTSNLKHKINFLEKSLQQLERERSELVVRTTMAEEQLKYFQESMNSSSQQYQKKILELNKKVN